MRQYLSAAFITLFLLGTLPILSGCNTTAGLGRDMSAAGHAVTKAAKKNRE